MLTGEALSAGYRSGRERLSAYVIGLTDEQLATPVPACPGWTVKETFCHVVANPIDGMAGRINGVPTDEFTADQIARFRDHTVVELVDLWVGASAIDAVIEQVGPPMAPIVIDMHTHEQDIRLALGDPVLQELPVVAAMAATGRELTGASDEIGDVELMRARLGRRSAAQVAAWPWPAGIPDGFFIFGPRDTDLVE